MTDEGRRRGLQLLLVALLTPSPPAASPAVLTATLSPADGVGMTVPLAVAVSVTDAGIGWLWGALTTFMVIRMVTMVVRFRSDAWLVTGAVR